MASKEEILAKHSQFTTEEIVDTTRVCIGQGEILPAMEEYKNQECTVKDIRIKELTTEITNIKKYISSVRNNALKTMGANSGILILIQKLEESFTWLNKG